MKKITFLAMVLSVFGLFAGTAQTTEFNQGIFVLNEGGAGMGNASVSFLTSAGVMQNNIYATVNDPLELGDTAQSMGFKGDNAYIVLNVSNKIEIVDAVSFEHVATITEGLVNPRYIAFHGNNAYITCWGGREEAGAEADDYIAIIDTRTNTITGRIAMAMGVERIIEANGKLYVAHQGGFSVNNLLTIVNPLTNTVDRTITIGDVPNAMAVKDGHLYVLCGGRQSWNAPETTGKLYKFNLSDNTLASATTFPGMQHPSNFRINGSDFYYTIDSGVYHTTATSELLPTAPLFSAEEEVGAYGMYAFEIIDNKMYLGDAGDYVNPGKALVYTMEGELLNEFTAGVSPNGFYKAPEPPVNGLNDNVALNISVYPNPASDVLYIATDKMVAVNIYDLAGRVVKSESYSSAGINVSGLAQGTYFVEMTINNSKTVKQVVIK